MHIPPHLMPVLWCATAISSIALISLGAGFSLMFGNVRRQKLGLRFVWISLALLAAAVVAFVVVLGHT